MSVSALFGTRVAIPPPSHGGARAVQLAAPPPSRVAIECSSRPQKKATAHHKKTRPRKTQAWDIRRRPAVYPPLPPLPADFTVVSSAADEDTSAAGAGGEAASQVE